MRSSISVALMGVVVAAIISDAAAQSNQLPTVQVRANRLGSPTVLCTGDDCASVIADLTSGSSPTHMIGEQEGPLYDDFDRTFCAALEEVQPDNCPASGSPPSVPGYDPSWQGNGCGSAGGGWFEESLLNYLLGQYPQYTGVIDNPLAGFSFLDACNAHDACWGIGADRDSCDNAFGTTLTGICNGNATCNGIAAGYRFAVGTSSGTEAYQASRQQLRCAAWRHDMSSNACPE